MTNMNRIVSSLGLPSLLALLCMTLALPLSAHEENLPVDFSGTWMPVQGDGGIVGFPRDEWSFTEQGRELREDFTAQYNPDKDDPAFFCVPPGMPMSMAPAAPFPLEIIHREQDVTLFFEAWSQYRKIWMADHDHPEAFLNSRMGHSVARWEGDTLVVETNNFSARTRGRSLMSEQARLVERISVETREDGTRMLVDEMIFSDPEIYTEDIYVRGVWEESVNTPILEYVCTEELYEQHLERVTAQVE